MSTISPEARMGNDIARQFAHLPAAEAVERISAHLSTFWTPQMRESLRALIAADSSEVDPLLALAAAR